MCEIILCELINFQNLYCFNYKYLNILNYSRKHINFCYYIIYFINAQGSLEYSYNIINVLLTLNKELTCK